MKFRPLAAALILLTACSYDVVKSRETSLPRPQGSPDLNFNKVYQTALATNCTSCHAGFSSYETVFSLRDQIASRVQSRDMPRGRAMPDDQRALLLEWLAAGAPRDAAGSNPAPAPTPAPTPTPPPTPEPDNNLGFNKVFQTSIATNCLSCHANFNSYDVVFSLRDQIASRVQSRNMPFGRVMPDNQRALLLEWLAAGAPRGAAGGDPGPTPQPESTPCPDDGDGSHSHLSHGNENCEPEKHLEEEK